MKSYFSWAVTSAEGCFKFERVIDSAQTGHSPVLQMWCAQVRMNSTKSVKEDGLTHLRINRVLEAGQTGVLHAIGTANGSFHHHCARCAPHQALLEGLIVGDLFDVETWHIVCYRPLCLSFLPLPIFRLIRNCI